MGTSTIDMSVTNKRNIVLISGSNDRGKTTLLAAIKFALYGEQQDMKTDGLINYQQANLGDGSMYVKLVFEHNGHEYNLRRSVEFRQVNTSDETPLSEPPQLNILEDGNDTELDQAWLEHLLPMDISQFFIFDGEQIQGYIDKSDTFLKDSIEKILGIKELLNAREDIRRISNKLTENRRSILTTQSSKQTKLGKYRRKLNELKDKRTGLRRATNQAKRDVIKHTEELNSHDRLKELNKESEWIANDIRKIETSEKDYINKVAEQRGSFGLFLLWPLLQLVDESGSSAVKEWESEAAHGVLERGFCVCDRTLDDERIRVLRAKTSGSTQKQRKLHNLVSKTLSQDFDGRMNGLVHALNSVHECRNKITHLEAKLYTINKEIDAAADSGFDYEYIVKCLREAQGNISKWNGELQKYDNDIIQINRNIKRIEEEIASNINSPELTYITKRLDMADKLVAATERVIVDFYEKRKPKLQKTISDVFLKLTNNPQLYEKIEIEDNFNIRIVRRNGMSSTTYGPSAGASQVIATAIISGLSKFATRDAPIVIDTPLGRLDPIHRKNVIRHYSKMGRQIIILYQQSEMNDRDIQTINNNIASEWEIASVPDQPDASMISLMGSNL